MHKLIDIRRLILASFVILYAILSLDVMMVFIPSSQFGNDFTFGAVRRPPVAYRVLVPLVTQVIQEAAPDGLKKNMTSFLADVRDTDFARNWLGLQYRFVPNKISDANIFDTFVVMFVVYITLLAFIWMMYVTARGFFPDSTLYRLIAPVIALLLVTPFVGKQAYTYDFAELFFSCACLHLLSQRRWWGYIGVLLYGTMNKETTLFIVIFYFIWFYDKMPRPHYIRIGLLQLLAYGVVEGTIRYYTANIAPIFEEGAYIFPIERTIMYMHHHDYTAFLHIMVATLLITYRWMEKPAFLRGAMWMVAMNAVIFVVMCNRGEYRDLYWCLPVLILLAAHTLVSASGMAQLPLFQPEFKKQKA